MPKTTYHTLTTANETVIKTVLNPTEFGTTMPQNIGLNSGVAVAFAGLTVALVGATWAGIDAQQFFGTAGSAITLGVATGAAQRARLGREAHRYLAEIALRREEWEDVEDEAEPWQEPERPPFMPELPSLMQKSKNEYTRIMHDLNQKEILLLNSTANVGQRFPTRKSLTDKGFIKNGQRFADLRAEFKKKGVMDTGERWTQIGVDWIRDEARRATSPAPN